jgi:hypothetical protein
MFEYCDYIAHLISTNILANDVDDERILKMVSHMKYDLHPQEGYMLSTKRVMTVVDKNSKRYKITVEIAE